MTQIMPSPPWPRSWYNFPIILCGLMLQMAWVIAIVWDQSVLDTTAIAPLLPYSHEGLTRHDPFWRWAVVAGLLISTGIAFWGFYMKRKIHNLMALIPQQFVMVVSSVGAIHAMINGRFHDGVVRSHAFLFADQSLVVWLTLFHTWAMILILIHSHDKNGD